MSAAVAAEQAAGDAPEPEARVREATARASRTPNTPHTPRAPRTLVVPRLALDGGEVLRDVTVAYHLDGPAEAVADDLVLVFHALTGTPDAVGDWWAGVLGPGRAVDTERRAVLSTNLLGSCYGTTGPAGPGGRPGPRFPAITPRDMARLAGHVVDALGARSVACVVGGSLGGMVAMEWALLNPGRARALVVLAAPAAHTAWAIGWNAVQRRALEVAGPEAGLALARMVGMMTFRTPEAFDARFGRARVSGVNDADGAPGTGEWAAAAWLDRHGERLVRRFDAASYRTLLDAMDAHDLGRDRGGLATALTALGAAASHVVGVGIPGDVLYTDHDVRAWTGPAGAHYAELHSPHGHDAFLLEEAQVAHILAAALAVADHRRPA